MNRLAVVVLSVIIAVGFVVNEYREWERLASTNDMMVRFMEQGSRFTREDGYRLCMEFKSVEPKMNCKAFQ